MRLKREVALLACLGLLLELSLILVDLVTGLDRTSPLLEPYFGVSYAIYVAAVVWVTRSRPESARESAVVIAAFGCAMGATFLLLTPSLSGDIYRYIWDGKLLAHGISPYSYPPYADQVASLRDSNWLLVQDKDIISPYPPLLELLNGLVYLVSPTVVAFKLAFLVPNLATIATLPLLLRKLNLDPRLSLIYSWNPLFVLEFSSSGHDDPLAVFLVLASFYLLFCGRRLFSAATMGLAVLSKLFPILIVPVLLRKWGAKGSAILGLLVVGFYAPFVLTSGNMIAPVAVYAFSSRSAFNGGVFSGLQYFLQGFGEPGAFDASRVVEYSAFLVVLAWLAWRAFRHRGGDIELLRYSAIVLTFYLVLSSTVQPWYLAWIFAPYLVLMPTWSWILFSGTIFLTYYTFTQTPIQPGFWAEIPLVKAVEYLQLYGMIAYEILRHTYFKTPPRQVAPEGEVGEAPAGRLQFLREARHQESVCGDESA